MKGRMMFVLHSHLPYVKRQGRWPFGEVWLFEAMAETYIPLLLRWQRLLEEGLAFPCTLSLSPTLLEQLSCPYLKQGFVEYLKEREEAARWEEKWFKARGMNHMALLAHDYVRFYQELRRDFVGEYDCDLVGAFLALKDKLPLEFIATAATHAYLPLLKDEGSLKDQIETGIRVFEKHLGHLPSGFWLPECGYYKGLEDVLMEFGIKYFFVDSHAIEGGVPVHSSSDPEILEEEHFSTTGLSTFRPYWVEGKPILVFGRNAEASQQVWSQEYGYPGDGFYLEFHKKSERTGLRYWKVTSRHLGLGEKEVYQPSSARLKVSSHAQHFVEKMKRLMRNAGREGIETPLVVACYDTELFGHWWWEGVDWLEETVRIMAGSQEIELVLPTLFLDQEAAKAKVFESSWGRGGRHAGWYNRDTAWMWETIEKACQIYREAETSAEDDWALRALAQARKELMLMESSDWFFMVTNNSTQDYALSRFFGHYAKLVRLCETIKNRRCDEGFADWLAGIEMEDDVFSEKTDQ